MTSRPILFSAPMVRAILAGTKSQTRRAVKYIPSLGDPEAWCHKAAAVEKMVGPPDMWCPFGPVTRELWVRETWRNGLADTGLIGSSFHYRADLDEPEAPGQWRPSIFMPRRASRITLRVTAVRVERLQAISEADARAEGCVASGGRGAPQTVGMEGGTARDEYRALWDSINGNGAWALDPWVWVVLFKKEKP